MSDDDDDDGAGDDGAGFAPPAASSMSPEVRAHLDAIIADPDNDAPRLAYAAYLKDKGDPRGEFIEVQIALAKRPSRSERIALKKREMALYRQARRVWVASFSKRGVRCTFRRGFVDEIYTYNYKYGSPFLGPAFAVEPIQKLSISVDSEAELKKLIALGFLGRVRSLVIGGIEGAKVIRVLSASLAASSLRSFSVGWKGLDVKGAKALGASPVFAGLERLNLTGSRVSDVELQALIDANPAFRLKALYLTRCKVTSKGLKALLASPITERLSILCINEDEEIDDEAFIALAKSKAAEHLTFLEARGTGLDDEGARALARSKQLKSLVSLRIADTPVVGCSIDGLDRLKARWGSKVVLGLGRPSGGDSDDGEDEDE